MEFANPKLGKPHLTCYYLPLRIRKWIKEDQLELPFAENFHITPVFLSVRVQQTSPPLNPTHRQLQIPVQFEEDLLEVEQAIQWFDRKERAPSRMLLFPLIKEIMSTFSFGQLYHRNDQILHFLMVEL